MRHDNVGSRADTGSIGGIRGSKLGSTAAANTSWSSAFLVERALELGFLGERLLGRRVVGELPRRRVAGTPTPKASLEGARGKTRTSDSDPPERGVISKPRA